MPVSETGDMTGTHAYRIAQDKNLDRQAAGGKTLKDTDPSNALPAKRQEDGEQVRIDSQPSARFLPGDFLEGAERGLQGKRNQLHAVGTLDTILDDELTAL